MWFSKMEMMEEVLHLFITNKCRHHCPLCCNRLYMIHKIPVVTVELLRSVKTICLTGGEPFSIESHLLTAFIRNIRCEYPNIKNLYIYTSGSEFKECARDYVDLIRMEYINGINIAPKDWKDWCGFAKCAESGGQILFPNENSNRLYVFKDQKRIFEAMHIDLISCNIEVIDRQWTKSFETPSNEHFARLPILFH